LKETRREAVFFCLNFYGELIFLLGEMSPITDKMKIRLAISPIWVTFSSSAQLPLFSKMGTDLYVLIDIKSLADWLDPMGKLQRRHPPVNQ